MAILLVGPVSDVLGNLFTVIMPLSPLGTLCLFLLLSLSTQVPFSSLQNALQAQRSALSAVPYLGVGNRNRIRR